MVAYLSHTLVGCLLTPPYPHAAILRLIGPQAKRAVAGRLPFGDSGGPGKFLLKTGKLGYHRGASWIKSAFPKVFLIKCSSKGGM